MAQYLSDPEYIESVRDDIEENMSMLLTGEETDWEAALFRANYLSNKALEHVDFSTWAAHPLISHIHEHVPASFSAAMEAFDRATGGRVLGDAYRRAVQEFAQELDVAIDHARDYETLDYLGIMTLVNMYLLKLSPGEVMERPQHMWMRVAVTAHLVPAMTAGASPDAQKTALVKTIESYELMSRMQVTHATPTLENAGKATFQGLSCFLFGVENSIRGFFKCNLDCAVTTQGSGGIGVWLSDVSAKGTLTSRGKLAKGVLPLVKAFGTTQNLVDQGARPGAFAMYLAVWHADIETFIDMRRPIGKDELRERKLFYAVCVCDPFMEAVRAGADWYLMCPKECPGLTTTYGAEFRRLYESYVAAGRYRTRVNARELMTNIISVQASCGMPYVVNLDAVNARSNQKNIGVIQSLNLCAEIAEFSSPDEYACCTLASISLANVFRATAGDLQRFYDRVSFATGVLVENLDNIIDINVYPTEEARRSNMRHRPMAIGVQGLTDVYMMLRLPYASAEARAINIRVFGVMYYAALRKSCDLARVRGRYSTFAGSPASRGELQFDLMIAQGGRPAEIARHALDVLSDLVTPQMWSDLKADIAKHGLRNALLCGQMPTATSSNPCRNTESIEVPMSHILVRRLGYSSAMVVNRHLFKELREAGLWSPDVAQGITDNGGSIAWLKDLPAHLHDVFRTAWEVDVSDMIMQSAERAPFIDQSQSLNWYIQRVTTDRMLAAYDLAWECGLKTLSYYIHSREESSAPKVSIPAPAPAPVPVPAPTASDDDDAPACSREDPTCTACSA